MSPGDYIDVADDLARDLLRDTSELFDLSSEALQLLEEEELINRFRASAHQGKEEPLEFGGEVLTSAVVTAALAVGSKAVGFVLNKLQDAVGEELEDVVRSQLQRSFRWEEQVAPLKPLKLSQDEIQRISDEAESEARNKGLDAKAAEALAKALIGRLVTTSISAEKAPPPAPAPEKSNSADLLLSELLGINEANPAREI
jgi:hypothetical protein